MIVADVDRFKAINDSYGHATGDAVLREIGYRVRKNLRAFESAYRIGGEEFVILLDDVDWDDAEGVARRLRECDPRERPSRACRRRSRFGLAASEPGRPFDYEATLHAAPTQRSTPPSGRAETASPSPGRAPPPSSRERSPRGSRARAPVSTAFALPERRAAPLRRQPLDNSRVARDDRACAHASDGFRRPRRSHQVEPTTTPTRRRAP